MKRWWTDLLSWLIIPFAAAPGVVPGPEGPLAVFVGVDGRVLVL